MTLKDFQGDTSSAPVKRACARPSAGYAVSYSLGLIAEQGSGYTSTLFNTIYLNQETGGKVIKGWAHNETESFEFYMVHKFGEDDLYQICRVGGEDSNDIDYMINHYIGSCNEYLATREEAVQRAKNRLLQRQ